MDERRTGPAGVAVLLAVAAAGGLVGRGTWVPEAGPTWEGWRPEGCARQDRDRCAGCDPGYWLVLAWLSAGNDHDVCLAVAGDASYAARPSCRG